MSPFERTRGAAPLRVGTGSVRGRGALIAAVVVTIALIALYLPTFAHAVGVWSQDEEFSFAFLVPPIALGLAWLRRDNIRGSLGAGSNLGLIVLLGGLLMLLASARSGVNVIAGASFVVTALGVIGYLYGLRALRATFYPVAFLAFGLCLYRGLLVSLGFTLQNLTAVSSARVSTLVGVPVQRNGVDLAVGQFHFVVAQACSGMSSLLALLCLGSVMVGLARSSMSRRVLMILLIVPIVLVANIVRVTLVLTLSQVVGLAVVNSIIHGAFSAIIFLIAFGLFFLAGKVVGCSPRIDDMLSSSHSSSSPA